MLPVYVSMDFSSQIIYSPITELNVVVFHINHEGSKSFIQVIHFHANEDDDKLTYSSSHSLVPKELRSLSGCFLGQKDKGEIILFGGFSDSDLDIDSEWSDSGEKARRNSYVWNGTLSVDGRDVIWKATNHVLPDIGFRDEFMFYFNDNIYIVENLDPDFDPKNFAYDDSWNSTCHKYSLKDKIYYENVFRFPTSWYPSQGFYRYGNLVSIDKYNKFSLIVAENISNGGKRNNVKGKHNDDDRKLLFFTEKEGFQEIRRFRSKERHTKNLRSKTTEQIQTKNSIIFAPHTI